jgi:hypothetical protein
VIRICAWCGVSLGELAPREDRAVTHGICDRCAERVHAGKDPSPPDPVPPCYWLLVVRRDAYPLFWHLRACLEDVPGVAVILDRRFRDRRHAARPASSDRRAVARRDPPGEGEAARLWRLGVRIVHPTGR